MQPLVGIIMGSSSDWGTMSHASDTLEGLGIPAEVRIVSAHRTPDALIEYVDSAESRGLEVIIAGAGGAAHLAGVTAAKTLLPVLGVPMESASLKGLDSLLSIVQMPAGVPVGTLAIGRPARSTRRSLPPPYLPRNTRSTVTRFSVTGKRRSRRYWTSRIPVRLVSHGSRLGLLNSLACVMLQIQTKLGAIPSGTLDGIAIPPDGINLFGPGED